MTQRVMDQRPGIGRVAETIEQPTHTIPGDCMCTWTVKRAGVGMAAISAMKYRNMLCPNRHRQDE
jgi:hypothetical protein